MEIERKFKVIKLPDNIEKYEKTEIEQGYLCIIYWLVTKCQYVYIYFDV